MALTQMDKMNLLGRINSTSIENFSYYMFFPKRNVKYTGSELIEFMINRIDYTLTNNFDHLALKKYYFAIFKLLGYLNSHIINTTDELEKEIRRVKNNYYSYIKEYDIGIDIEINEYLNGYNEYLKKDNEEVADPSLLGDINRLTKSNEDKTKEIEDLKLKLADKNDSIDEKNLTITEQLKQLKELKQQLKLAEKKIISLEEDMKDKDTSISILAQEKNELNFNISELHNDLFEYQEKLKIVEQEKNSKDEYQSAKKEILKHIYLDSMTIEEIIDILSDKYSKEDVYSMLIELSKDYYITGIDDYNGVFGIGKIKPEGEKTLKLNTNGEVIDLLFISDIHYKSKNYDLTKENIDYVYDYIAKKNISKIINLGDLFNNYYCNTDKTPYEIMLNFEKEMVELLKIIPKNVEHYILGGNHDNFILAYGIDCLKKINERRIDLHSLGYNYANIKINNDIIKLHHPNLNLRLDIINSSNLLIKKHLSDYYDIQKKSRDDVYLDVFGHIHKSLFDTINNSLLIPSLTFDRVHNGATHLKIYLNSAGNIDYIVIIPLTVKDKLIPTNEIIYQKALSLKK